MIPASVRGLLIAVGLLAFLPTTAPAQPSGSALRPGEVMTTTGYYIIIDISANALYVYTAQGRIATFRAVFGTGDPGDKMMEGDNKTPLGVFHVVAKKVHPEWGPFLLLDYPTADSYKKFNARKAAGEIPENAGIGGGVGIHGTRPGEEFVVDKLMNWTSGCVSVKLQEAWKLYKMIPIGTEVLIRE